MEPNNFTILNTYDGPGDDMADPVEGTLELPDEVEYEEDCESCVI